MAIDSEDGVRGVLPDFAVDVRREPHEIWVYLAGELDISTAPRLVDAVDRIDAIDGMDAGGVRMVVLDLSQVTFCDARGLATLIQTRQTMAENGRRLTIQGVSPQLRRLLAITGEQGILDLY